MQHVFLKCSNSNGKEWKNNKKRQQLVEKTNIFIQYGNNLVSDDTKAPWFSFCSAGETEYNFHTIIEVSV